MSRVQLLLLLLPEIGCVWRHGLYGGKCTVQLPMQWLLQKVYVTLGSLPEGIPPVWPYHVYMHGLLLPTRVL